MSVEYRYRISEEERKMVIDAFEDYILNNYNKISNEELKNCLKLIIKFITYDRKNRRAFEEIIDIIIEKFNRRKIKEAKEILKKIVEYEKKR